MESTMNATGTATRTAQCACGGLKITITGTPARVYACSCLECQRATGTAFSYRALFAQDAIACIAGDRRTWRRSSDSGRWVEQTFCPNCGTLVYMDGEALSGAVVISVGCFGDPGFAAPATLFRAARRHHWYALPDGMRVVD